MKLKTKITLSRYGLLLSCIMLGATQHWALTVLFWITGSVSGVLFENYVRKDAIEKARESAD